MTLVTNSGPALHFGITQTSTGQVMQYNEDRGPSGDDLGSGLMDPRPFYRYQPGGAATSSAAIGFGAAQTMLLWDNFAYVDYVPITLNASNIAVAASNAPTSGGTLTLAAAGSSVGAISTTLSPPEGGNAASVIALDSTAAFVAYGQTGNITAWNPRAGTGRGIVITTSSSGDGGSVTVAGRDMYGYKLTEQVVLSTATNTAASSNAAGYKWPTKKMFKYVSAVTASTTVTSTGWSVGMNDTYGLPALATYTGFNTVVNLLPTSFSSVAAVLLSSATTVLGATATATATTGDVRGTYASTTASNGTVRLQIFQGFDAFTMSQITASDQSAMFGQTQFSSV